MFLRCLLPACLLFAALLPAAADDDAARAKALVADLGDRDATSGMVRKAKRELAAMGEAAAPAIEEACRSEDLVLRARAEDVLAAIRLDPKLEPSAWVTLPDKPTPAKEVLLDIARQAARVLDVGSAKLEGKVYPGGGGKVTLWQAMDLVCTAADCTYDLKHGVTLAAGPAPVRQAFYSGPFRVMVLDVKRDVNLRPLGVRVAAEAEPSLGLDPSNIHIGEGGDALDDQGSRVKHQGWGSRKGVEGVTLGYDAPSVAATHLKRMSCTLSYSLVLRKRSFVFDADEKAVDRRQVVDGMGATLTWAGKDERFHEPGVKITVEDVRDSSAAAGQTGAGDELGYEVHDRDGKSVEVGATSSGREDHGPTECEFSWEDNGRGPYKATLTVTTWAARAIRCELHDVPLPPAPK